MKKLTTKEIDLILQYQDLIWKVIHDIEKKFNLCGVEPAELFQEGNLFLMEKIRTWKPSKGKFVSWFYQQIKQHLIRFIISQQKLVMTDIDDSHFKPSVEVTANIGELIEETQGKLSARQKEYFNEYYTNDRDVKDIANQFKVSKRAVTKILAQINKKIKIGEN